MNPTDSSGGFHSVARFASAIGCGVAAGFLYSLKQVNPNLQLEFGAGSLIMGVVGALVASGIWRLAFQLSNENESESAGALHAARRRKLLALAGILIAGTLASYVYVLKDVRRAALLEVVQGVALAFVVVAGIGVVLLKLIRLLEREEPPDGSAGSGGAES